MTRDEALTVVSLLHAYARGVLTRGEPGVPSTEERAWAHALEVDARGATRADGVEGVRRAATQHPRPTLADVVRYTCEAREARRAIERERGDLSRPALPPPREDTSRDGARAWAVRQMLASEAGRAELRRADLAEIGRRIEETARAATGMEPGSPVRAVANAVMGRLPDLGRDVGSGR